MQDREYANGLSVVGGAALDEVSVDVTLPCRSFDPDLFFAETPADVEYAKTICADCPVRAACLAGALERREPWGVWGGQLFIAGVVVLTNHLSR